MVRMIGNLGLAVGRRPQFFSTCYPMELLDMANDMVADFPYMSSSRESKAEATVSFRT